MRKGVFSEGGSGSVYREVKLLKMHEARLDLMLYFDVCVLLEQV